MSYQLETFLFHLHHGVKQFCRSCSNARSQGAGYSRLDRRFLSGQGGGLFETISGAVLPAESAHHFPFLVRKFVTSGTYYPPPPLGSLLQKIRNPKIRLVCALDGSLPTWFILLTLVPVVEKTVWWDRMHTPSLLLVLY